MIEYFKVLSDENRLKMFSLMLVHNEVCVCVFEDTLNMKQANVSKHLIKMKENNMVTCEKRGKYMYYKVSKSFLEDNKDLVMYIKMNSKDVPMNISCRV